MYVRIKFELVNMHTTHLLRAVLALLPQLTGGLLDLGRKTSLDTHMSTKLRKT